MKLTFEKNWFASQISTGERRLTGKNLLENQPRYKMANARVEWPTVRMRSISWDLCGRWPIELQIVSLN